MAKSDYTLPEIEEDSWKSSNEWINIKVEITHLPSQEVVSFIEQNIFAPETGHLFLYGYKEGSQGCEHNIQMHFARNGGKDYGEPERCENVEYPFKIFTSATNLLLADSAAGFWYDDWVEQQRDRLWVINDQQCNCQYGCPRLAYPQPLKTPCQQVCAVCQELDDFDGINESIT